VKWREFITLLGGAAAAWPLTAQAQQRRAGALDRRTEDQPEAAQFSSASVSVFEQSLAKLGWTVGRNIAIDC
jgi:putative ABC transport system substrate-binding protein